MPMTLTHLDSERLPPSDDSLFERIASEVELRGYAILPAALPQEILDSLQLAGRMA